MDKKYFSLYNKIKSDIHSGKLRPGEKLSSKRSVCVKLKISLTTVTRAYENLVSEGLVVSRERRGYFVADSNSLFIPHHPSRPMLNGEKCEECEVPSGWITTMRKVLSAYPNIISFKPDFMGSSVLRKAISDFLYRYRNLSVSPDNILIGSGAEELYSKIVQLLGRDKTYAIENPCYEKIEKVYTSYGVKIQKLPLSSEGINLESLRSCNAEVLHVSPFHSYPSGITATKQVRAEYLKRTVEGRWLVEDDYDSEFFFGAIPETLFGESSKVLYMNTFSKSISPAIRIGYLVLPDTLAQEYRKNFSSYTCPVPIFEQYVLASFITEGLFERHLNKKRLKLLKGSI